MNWLALSIVLAAMALLAWAAILYAAVRTVLHIPVLASAVDGCRIRPPRPRVHAVVPARDEAESMERALASLAGQSYDALTVTAVDDRSTDGTSECIQRVAAASGNVRRVRVHTLPDGWLGKVHALSVGAADARDAEWLLFTDADVRFGDGALEMAVAFAESRRLDLLTAYPEVEPAGVLADAAFDVVTMLMAPAARLWRMPDPDSSAVGAAGAFILVRASAWARTDGFEAIRLEIADDFAIATLVKRAAGRCAIVNGRGLVRLRWYASCADMVRRTQKNFWAVVGRFDVVRSLGVMALLAALAYGPIALLAIDGSAVRVLAGAAMACMFLASVITARWLGRGLLPALLVPVGMGVVLVAFARAVVLGVRTGGVRWRETFYSNDRLRRGRVIEL